MSLEEKTMFQSAGRSRSGFGLFFALMLVLSGWSATTVQFGAPGTAYAQSAFGFPEDIDVVELVSGDVTRFGATPDTLVLERVTLAGGDGAGARVVSTADLIFVEKGTLKLEGV